MRYTSDTTNYFKPLYSHIELLVCKAISIRSDDASWNQFSFGLLCLMMNVLVQVITSSRRCISSWKPKHLLWILLYEDVVCGLEQILLLLDLQKGEDWQCVITRWTCDLFLLHAHPINVWISSPGERCDSYYSYQRWHYSQPQRPFLGAPLRLSPFHRFGWFVSSLIGFNIIQN